MTACWGISTHLFPFLTFSVSSVLFETMLGGKEFAQTKLASGRNNVPSLLLEQLQIQVREDNRDTQRLTRTDRGGRRPATSVRSASSAYLIDIFRCHHGGGTANANAANAGWNVNASADFPSEQKHAGKAELR